MDNNNLRNIKYVIGEDIYNKISLLMDWAGMKKDSDSFHWMAFFNAFCPNLILSIGVPDWAGRK